jgi:hypothetical protein
LQQQGAKSKEVRRGEAHSEGEAQEEKMFCRRWLGVRWRWVELRWSFDVVGIVAFHPKPVDDR